jgi:hypothetical protein
MLAYVVPEAFRKSLVVTSELRVEPVDRFPGNLVMSPEPALVVQEGRCVA